MILVVGGAGYIGSHVNKLLSAYGYNTIVLDNLVSGHIKLIKWGSFVLGDLANLEHLRLLFKKYPIKAVMHFAAFAYVRESVIDPQKYYLNNLQNTINLLQAMNEANVNKIIFSSSCAVYGIPLAIPIDETHLPSPINPYGQSKLMVERILADYSKAYGLNYVTLRYFNAAGADPDGECGEIHEPETHLIPRALEVALNKSDCVRIYGNDYETPDGTCIRDYIHVVDLAIAHRLALDYLLGGGKSEVINLGNGHGFSVSSVLNQISAITKKNINSVIEGRREGDPAILVACSEKAKAILHWEPQFSNLDEIVMTAWHWHRKLYK